VERASFEVEPRPEPSRQRPLDNLRAQALTANEGADFLPDAAREHMAREIERATTPTAS